MVNGLQLGKDMDLAIRAGKVFLMIAGGLALVYMLGSLVFSRARYGLCDVTVLGSSVTEDQKVKATVYQTECGAMAASRAHIALSNPLVDGTKSGEEVVTLLHSEGDPLAIHWQTDRDLIVSYHGEVEYAVAKTRGVRITLQQ